MKEAIGEQQSVEYQVDCPYCGETSYSDVCSEEWRKLEWGDGTPYGTLECSDCDKEFNISIG